MPQFTLIIKNETTDEQETLPIAGQDNASKPNPSSSELNNKQVMLGKSLVAWKQVKGYVAPIVNYEINQIQLRSGRTELQQQHQFSYNLVNDGLGIMETIAAGAAVGHVAGAIAGAVVGLVSKGISISQNVATINTERDLENVTLRMNRIRAGAGGSREQN